MTDDWYVYIVECKDDSLYTGITNNLKKRMDAHKRGTGSKYVRSRKFNRLLHVISQTTKSDAAKLEYAIKQLERNDKITFFVKHPDRIHEVE